MKEKLKKCLAFLTAANIILGTTSCSNNKQIQEDKQELTENTQDEITQLTKKLTNKNCIINNNKIYVYDKQKDSWYENLNELLKYYESERIVLTNRMDDEIFDISKITFLKTQRLELNGKFDISDLSNKNTPNNINITSECINIDKVPEITSLTIHNTNNTDITNTLKNIEKNNNAPRNLSLYNFTSENIPIQVDKLTIIYDKEVPSKLTVDTNYLTLIHNTTYAYNNSLVEKSVNDYTYENNNISYSVTNEQEQETTTILYNLPTIKGNYNQLSIETFNVDYDTIKNKNNLSIKYGNINNTTIENIIENKTELFNVILNNEDKFEYYSHNNTDNTRSYYKVPREYANELSQGREDDFYDKILSEEYEIDRINIKDNTTAKVYKKTKV